jgi:hypothetical protein
MEETANNLPFSKNSILGNFSNLLKIVGVSAFLLMPELAEVHSYARSINEWSNGVVFDGVEKHATGKGPDVSLWVTGLFTLFARARGKELKLVLTPQRGSDLEVTFRHGLVGIWEWSLLSSLPKHTHIHFASSSAGKALW